MEGENKGAWIIHHSNKLQALQSQNGFENIHLSGRAGILLSSISASNQAGISNAKLHALAEASQINLKIELPILLAKLSDARLIDVGQNGIDVLGITTLSTLNHIANIFEDENPHNREKAVIQIAELASVKPILEREIREEVSDSFKLSKSEIDEFFEKIRFSGMLDYETLGKGENIYFNGNIFRSASIEKTHKILNTLKEDERNNLLEVDESLKKHTCVPVEDIKAKLGISLFERLIAIGYYDVNTVNNTSGDFAFITRPASFSKYSKPIAEDAFDNAKALVSSLTYGMISSHRARGQITMVDKLLAKLIRGEWVGPVPAIGEDYRALVMRRVVEVEEVTAWGKKSYRMRLLKRDVGELALKVIERNDVSDESLTNFPETSMYSYSGPETNREAVRRKQSEVSKSAAFRILDVLVVNND